MGVYKCPVCEGRGFVSRDFYISQHSYGTTNSTATETCRTCGGKGIVFDAEMFSGNVYPQHHQGDPGYMTFQCKGTCSNCDYNDRMCYTSHPPKWKCTLDGWYHTADYRCEHWAEQQQKYIQGVQVNDLSDDITPCRLNATGTEDNTIEGITIPSTLDGRNPCRDD